MKKKSPAEIGDIFRVKIRPKTKKKGRALEDKHKLNYYDPSNPMGSQKKKLK